jgi:hypothetical protein
MISEPHRGHAPAQFNINLSEFLVLDIALHCPVSKKKTTNTINTIF